MRVYHKECPSCGEKFITHNAKRIYCGTRCRRDADNERKRDRRAEEAELRAEFDMPDDWALNILGEDVTMNSLTDGWTEACDMCPDEAIGGPLACQQCPHWKAKEKSRRKAKIDLLCEMCRSGCRV